jgi:ABC-type dipeptide/oligopeptide/nickel transport system permease component
VYYFSKRILGLLFQVLLIFIILFFLFRLLPGDPALMMMGGNASEVELELFREKMGLNKPITVQFVEYMFNIVRGDFGISTSYNRPVLTIVTERVWPTVKLMLTAIGIAFLFGFPSGLLAGLYETKWWSKSFLIFFVIILAVPNFWLGMLMMQLFSVRLGWLPAIGYGSNLALVMPALAVSARLIALIARLSRSVIIDVLHQDYIRTAESKGMSPWKIIFKHVLRPALPPIITLIGLQAGYLLGGSIVVENLFSYQGMGQLMLAAQKLRDYNLMQGIIIFFVGSFLFINLLVDLLYTRIDPRISLE